VAASDQCDLLCLDLDKAERLRGDLDRDALAPAAVRARALAEPTRLTLAALLAATDELCVCDLAWITGRPVNLVSYHLRALRDAGLARTRREHRVVFYALTPAGRELLAAVVGEAEITA
jgi:DNA-binding transcriptional ArsR family regulator